MTPPAPYPGPLSGAHFQILPRDTDRARRLVVFFGAKDLGEASFNFFQLGRELSDHVVFVNNGANDWYQYGIPGLAETFEDAVQLLRDWAACLEVEEICCVGTSMGGWGAIRYGAALDARVLAFSSDAILNDPVSRSRKHFTGTGPVPCPDLRQALSGSNARVTLIVGERDATDLHAARLLGQHPCVEAISLVGCAHIVPSHLSRDARLGPLLRCFVADKPLPHFTDKGRALDNPAYIAALYDSQQAWMTADWAGAAHHAQIALGHQPHGEAAEVLLGGARIKMLDFAGAIAPLASVAVSCPATDPEALDLLALAWRKVGALERSAQLSLKILTQHPGNARAHYNLALLARLRGESRNAIIHTKAALKRDPRNSIYRDLLGKLPPL